MARRPIHAPIERSKDVRNELLAVVQERDEAREVAQALFHSVNALEELLGIAHWTKRERAKVMASSPWLDEMDPRVVRAIKERVKRGLDGGSAE